MNWLEKTWQKLNDPLVLSPSDNALTESVLLALFSLASDPKLIYLQTDSFRKAKTLSGKAKTEAFIRIYFDIENFLVRQNPPLILVDFKDKYAVRRWVAREFTVIGLPPLFRIIFLPGLEQLANLFCLGITELLSYEFHHVHERHFEDILRSVLSNTPFVLWIDDVGKLNTLLTKEPYKNLDTQQVVNIFKQSYSILYYKLAEELGPQGADTLFQKVVDYIQFVYDYEITAAFLEVVPEQVGSKERMTYLSREDLEQKVLSATEEERDRRKQAEQLSRELDQQIKAIEQQKSELEEARLALSEAKSKVEDQVLVRTRELQEERARLLASMESLSLGFAILDMRGNVFHANKALHRILSDGAIETIGDIQQRLNHAASVETMFSDCLANKSQVERKDILLGTTYLRLFFSPILLTQSEVIGATMVVEDVTHDREVDRAKNEFVILASHQLRTPLTIVKWYVELLKKKLDGKTEDEVPKYLDALGQGAERMTALVRALLNVSRIEMGKLAINPEATNIADLCKQIVGELVAEIEVKQLKVKQEYAKNIPEAWVDKSLLRMVIENLLTNAIKYTNEGGSIKVAVSTKEFKGISKDHIPAVPSIYISVTDTGLGIPKEAQSKIYTKLFRADNVKLTKTSGTGLGLYIVKGVVEVCGGNIWFESELGKGTTFYVTIPVQGMAKREGSNFMLEQPNENPLFS